MTKRVLIILGLGGEYGREVLHGVQRYILENNVNWELMLHDSERFLAGHRLHYPHEWTACGVISQSAKPAFRKFISRCGMCAVVVTGDDVGGAQSVCADSHAVGRMGAGYLMGLNLAHMGYCGVAGWKFSEERRRGFCEETAARGIATYVREIDYLRERVPERILLARWLVRVPKPIGVMTCHDNLATDLYWACRERRLRVPEDVAILGVDNDPNECCTCPVSISSVSLPIQQIGFAAAEQLDQMLKGRGVVQPLQLAPLGIARRMSTDRCITNDPAVVQAISFIRAHASEPITVEDILSHVLVSRRSLDYKFRQATGCTVYEHIARIKIDAAKLLLAGTNTKIGDVAGRVGFLTYSIFGDTFRRLEGISPRQYREQSGQRASQSTLGEYEPAASSGTRPSLVVIKPK